MPTRLLLTRHGEAQANVERRLVGHAESPLTARGRRQAEALAMRLHDEPIVCAYASDLSRACETATLALAGRDVELRVEPGLRELYFGAWEGLNFREIERGWAHEHRRLLAIDETFCAPEGEPLSGAGARIARTIATIAAAHAHETVLIVAHGGSLQLCLARLLAMPLHAVFRLAIGHCTLSAVEFHGEQPLVTLVNDGAHLAGVDAEGTDARGAAR